MQKFILFSLIILFSFSCKKKEKNIVITGTVTDTKSGLPASGLSLGLYIKEVASNSYSSNKFTLLETVSTDNQGKYSFSNPYKTAEQYKITSQSTSYYDHVEMINPDNLTTEHDNTINFTINSKSYYKIAFKNANPFDSNDEILFSVSNTDLTNPDGCGAVTVDLFGMLVDTLVSCPVYGGQTMSYSYVVTKNSITNQYSGNTYCPVGDTAIVTIQY